MSDSSNLPSVGKTVVRRLAASVAVLALGFGYVSVVAAPAHAADTFTIPDSALADCVNAAISHEGNSYGTFDLYGLTSLTCDGAGISSLMGLDNAPYLAELNLANNELRSLVGLSTASLQTLNISGNHLSDLSFLGRAGNLTSLAATGQTVSWTVEVNEATAVPLRDGSANVPGTLTSTAPELVISDGEVTGTATGQFPLDFSSVSSSGSREFSGTVTVTVAGNTVHIPDVGLAGCLADKLGTIGSVFILDDIAGIEILQCSGRGIENLSGAENLTGATYLDFSRNKLAPSTGNTDPLAPLSGLTSLVTLNLSAAGVTGIGSLASLTGLVNLDIYDNSISDISPLGGLVGLTSLEATGQKLTQTVEADTARTLGLVDRAGNLPEVTTVDGVTIQSGQVTAVAGIHSLSFANATTGDSDPVTFSGTLELRAHVDVHFASLGLSACVADSLDIRPTPDVFSNLDLARITGLYCPDASISSLQGIEYLTNLAAFEAQDTSISDLTPLSNLRNLASLNLNGNQVQDLSPLAGLPDLQVLYVSNNMLDSVDPLAEVPTLTYVQVAGNRLLDIDALASLTNMVSLDVSSNQLTDLSAVSAMGRLQTLHASHNQLSDVADLASVKALRNLYVSDNQISSLAGLEKLSKISQIRASANRISSLAPLATRTSLMILDVDSNNITSLSPLASLPLLVSINASDNQITDVSPLAGKWMLNQIELHHNQIADLSSLSASTAYLYNAREQAVSLSVVPQVATQLPLLDRDGNPATLGELPAGLSVADGKLTAEAEGTYTVSFRSGDLATTQVEFSGTLTVVSAYHTFTVPTPTISGAAQVDATLTVDPGTWGPESTHLAYQWQRDGVDIQNATNSTYQVRAEDVGAEIGVVVTATSDGYTPASASAVVTVPITTASFVAPDDVTVSGTFAVGNTVSVDAGTWTPSPQSFTYQWLRDGVAITDATDPSYTLTADDANHAVSVRVAAIGDGYAQTSLNSVSKSVALGTLQGAQPVISGTANIGQTLQIETGSWSPTPSLTCQWYRAGEAISGATECSYDVTTADVGAAITVAQTGSLTGYQPLTLTSAPTSVVPQGTLAGPTSITVTGTMAVGKTLTADPGEWTPEPVEISYQWLRDGAAISGATNASYSLAASDEGHAITVAVTAHKTGYADATVASTSSTAVAAGSFVTTDPTISGSPVFGQVLSASLTAWAPTANLSWQWLRDGVAINGATGSNYLLRVADIGASISVQVTGNATGYAAATTTSTATDPVSAAQLSGPNAVTVSGEKAVGQTLRVDAMTWSPTPDSLSYQWLRDGVAIDDATSPTYTLTAADLDKHITVSVVARRDGYTTINLSSTEEATVAASAFSAEAPVISGNAVVGQSLAATSGAWTPMPTTISYQWLADGDPIALATSNTYLVTPAVLGKAIGVRVTGSRDGYAEKSIEAAATAEVAAALMSGPATAAVTGTFTVGETVSAAAGTWTPAPDEVSYQWLRGGHPIAGATQADYTLGTDDADKIVTVQITLTKGGYRNEVIRSVAADPVAPAQFAAATPQIDGEAALGGTLTAVVGTWSPTPASTSIQWLRDGVAISGATASTYAPTVADVGKVISVAVSGSAAGYAPHTATSSGTDPVAAGTFTAPSKVTVSGDYTVGKTLSVDPGTWTPAPAEFGYQWLRDGAPIANATRAEYSLVAADHDAVITVTVTAARPGYTEASLVSTSATHVGKGTIVTEKPAIAGQSKVGATLTAKPGDWSPAPSAWTYQWLRDGEVIADETAATYKVAEADLGASISVKVSGSLAGYTTTAEVESDPAEVSPQGSFTAPDEITVEGTYSIGETLTAQAGDWTPTPDAVHFQWLRSGKVIAGATGDRYTLDADDLGKVVTVKATASKGGYRSASARSQAPVAVAAATFSAPNPRILGSVALGKVLVADPGTWSTTPTLTYQWYRAGIAVRGATRAVYTVGVADVGKRLSVKVTGTRPGYATAVKVSAVTAAVRPGALVGPRPVLSGKAKAKSTLKVKIGRWTPSGIRVSYKWYRNGSPIKGATKSQYRLTSKDRGKRIGVRVTYRKSGYVTRTRWVKSSKPVK